MGAKFMNFAATATLLLGASLVTRLACTRAPLWSLIDIQNDFINGSLNNPRAPAILPKVYKLLDDHEWPFIVASQDWHPKGHVSFASAHPGSQPGGSVQVPFVETPLKTETQAFTYAYHCVPGTWGAQLENGIQSRLWDLEGYRAPVHYIKKAQDHSVDSACVRGTSIDGIKLGYEIVLIEDATESISAEARKAGVKNLTDWEAENETDSD
ncbi:hypothetical protein PMIN06_002879 [Paraphaeosphaeria minitans]